MRRIVRTGIAAFLITFSLEAAAGTTIVSREPHRLPEWLADDRRFRNVEQTEYERARGDGSLMLERLTYRSDGLEVVAYLYRSREGRNPAPAVILNRGGYITPGLEPRLVPLMHLLARSGFVVLAPMYRQSDGAGGVDLVGGADLGDVMQLLEVARELPFVDESRLAMVGESRGGMMTLQAIREKFPLRAAATIGAFTDFQKLVAGKPDLYEPLLVSMFPRLDEEREQIVRRRSAMAWANALDAPLLILHGGADTDVDPSHAIALAGELQRLDKPYELHILRGAGHTLVQRQDDRDALLIRWLRMHLEE